jgi:hypothetical protein
MLKSLLPRETSFFDFFEKHSKLTHEGALEFERMAEDGEISRTRRIKEIEHETDVVTHQCVEALHKTFITPIDRNDIHRLISRMDDVMDLLDAASDRVRLYELHPVTGEIQAFAALIVRSTGLVQRAVAGLRDMKASETIKEACIEINRIENDGDALFRKALARLFKEEKDAISVIKWKEVFEALETCLDRAEDVANTIEGIVLEHA